MIVAGRLPIFTITFAAVYAVVYVVAVEQNYALFTYHPALSEFELFVAAPKAGPAMYWYGWMATSAIVAFAVGVILSFVPAAITKFFRSSWSWVIPMTVMLVFGYLLRDFFIPKDVAPPAVQQPRGDVE
jgi:hypothetical protein